MRARLRKLAGALADAFWLVPALLIAAGMLAAVVLLDVDRRALLPAWVISGHWLYDGGGTGARTLLGAVAASTIGVAGTVFSITIAALSLAAGQMGPRLLRNFTRDRGNQVTLGAFLGTFAYALLVLRSVRTQDEGAFTPHLALTFALVLAFACLAVLVYFVQHMASRISVDVVIDLVAGDVHAAMGRLLADEAPVPAPPAAFWQGAALVRDARRGYLLHLDAGSLADWAASHGASVRLLVRPGDFLFPGAPVAAVLPAVDGADEAVRTATALGSVRSSADDIEYAVRQLVEVAVRALSPGINDPHTAIAVLDRLGAALCDAAGRHLPTGVLLREGRLALEVPNVDYAGLVDSMFHMIRQSGAGSPAVLVRMLAVLTAVATVETEPGRLAALQRHADLVLEAATRAQGSPADLADVRERHARFLATRAGVAAGQLPADRIA